MPNADQTHSALKTQHRRCTEIAARLLDQHILQSRCPLFSLVQIRQKSAQPSFLTRICRNLVDSMVTSDESPESPARLCVQSACCQHASLSVAPLQVALKGGPPHCQAPQAHPRTHLFQKLLPLPMCSTCCHNIEARSVAMRWLRC